MKKTITLYRYFISYGYVISYKLEIERETPSFYYFVENTSVAGMKRTKIHKEEENKAIVKDPTHYPYVDFYSTENDSYEYAVENILNRFKRDLNNYYPRPKGGTKI